METDKAITNLDQKSNDAINQQNYNMNKVILGIIEYHQDDKKTNIQQFIGHYALR